MYVKEKNILLTDICLIKVFDKNAKNFLFIFGDRDVWAKILNVDGGGLSCQSNRINLMIVAIAIIYRFIQYPPLLIFYF